MVYRKFVKCPYCQKEVSLSGIDMHVKMKHGENYKDFRSKFEDLKKTAVGRQTAPAAPAKEPPKAEPPKPPAPPKEDKGILTDLFSTDEEDIETEIPKPPRKVQGTKKYEPDLKPPKGGGAPPAEKSFLDKLDDLISTDII